MFNCTIIKQSKCPKISVSPIKLDLYRLMVFLLGQFTISIFSFIILMFDDQHRYMLPIRIRIFFASGKKECAEKYDRRDHNRSPR